MNPPKVIINDDGRVEYFRDFYDSAESTDLFEALRTEISWQHDQLIMFGKPITMRRKSAWHAENNQGYKYGGILRKGLDYTEALTEIQSRINQHFQLELNSCLANYYHDGNDGMGYHADNESMLDPKSPIASISLGAERVFRLRHNTLKDTHKISLENGSLLIMFPPCQEKWKHELVKQKQITEPRINLTFRRIN